MQSDDAAFFAFFFAAEMTGQKLTGTAASGLSAVTGKDFSQLVLCARVSAAMSNNRTQLIGKSYYCITAIFQTIFTIYRQGRSFAVYFAVSFHERILGTKVAFFFFSISSAEQQSNLSVRTEVSRQISFQDSALSEVIILLLCLNITFASNPLPGLQDLRNNNCIT